MYKRQVLVLDSRHLEDTCGLVLGIAQWSCLHVIGINEVNSNAVTNRLDSLVKGKDNNEENVMCVRNRRVCNFCLFLQRFI